MSSRKRQKKNKLIFMDGRMDDVLDGLLNIDFLMMTDMDDDEVGYTAPTAAAAIAPGSTPTPTPAPIISEGDKIIKLKNFVDPVVTLYISDLSTNYNGIISKMDLSRTPYKSKIGLEETINNSLIDLIEEGVVNVYPPTTASSPVDTVAIVNDLLNVSNNLFQQILLALPDSTMSTSSSFTTHINQAFDDAFTTYKASIIADMNTYVEAQRLALNSAANLGPKVNRIKQTKKVSGSTRATSEEERQQQMANYYAVVTKTIPNKIKEVLDIVLDDDLYKRLITIYDNPSMTWTDGGRRKSDGRRKRKSADGRKRKSVDGQRKMKVQKSIKKVRW